MSRTFLLTLAVLLVPSSAFAPSQPLTALDPVEIYADGFQDLRGIGVDPAGHVVVADRAAGTVTRIAPDRTKGVVASGLERPIGLALDPSGRLLVAEEKAAHVVRLEPDGSRTPLVTGIKQPRWLAVGEDGTLYVAARRLTRGTDPEPDDESAEPEVILALSPTGQFSVLADSFRHLQGLAVNGAMLFAATRGRQSESQGDGVVFQLPLLADGSAGPITTGWPRDAFKKPVGLARDRLGALWLTTKELDLQDDESKRAVAKLHPSGAVTLFAQNLAKPQGLAFDATGHLYVADGSSGRVLRFLAPAAPTLTSPTVITQSVFSVTGTTAPGARVDLFVNDAPTPVTVTADATGTFTATVPLTPNAVSTLDVFATTHGGQGLTSPPAELTVTHDDQAPALALLAPPAGAHVRGLVLVQAQASDGGTGVASLALAVDGVTLPATVTPGLPAAATTASASRDTLTLTDGTHTLRATATDATGNVATATRVVLVDNTPPDTVITGGPSGAIPATEAIFSFGGTDNLTPAENLRFAWRLDGGAWAEFGTGTTATLTGLALGPHLFEVTARDLAGNEDPTPAQATFIVGAGVQVRITSPSDGAKVPAGMLLVTGTVDAGGTEVGVAVNGIPAFVDGALFAAQAPVVLGPTSVLAVATTVTGASASHAVTLAVSAAPEAEPEPVFSVAPTRGIAPLAVAFTLTGAPAGTLELDADGDGVVDLAGDRLDGQIFTYLRPGLYLPTVAVTDATGTRQTLRAVVQVFDLGALDGWLQARWAALREALRRGDVDGAVSLFALSSREAFRDQFTALAGVGALPQVGTDLGAIRLVQARQGAVTYDLRAVRNGVEYSFHVLFVVDTDGVWRLWAF